MHICHKPRKYTGLKVLDCTLRDGGYYNKWDFDSELVKLYLLSMCESNIDVVELGLRNFSKDQFLGAHAYTTEEYLSSIDLPEGPTYGVMVDATTILNSCYSNKDAIARLFVDAINSNISLVRVAAHFKDLALCAEICERLKAKGYIVGLNMMQSGGKTSDILSDASTMIASWGCVDILYFADSLGSMDHLEVTRIVEAIRMSWSGNLGIHAHDNMNRAISNTMHAKSLGVEWIDSTVCGMGRGAGNAQTEYLLPLLQDDSYNPEPIYSLVIEHFQQMKCDYGWGSNLLYFIGAINNIHPTFIQTLISSPKYQKQDFLPALKYLSNDTKTFSYSDKLLNEAMDFGKSENPVSGSLDLVGKFIGREILVLADSQAIVRYNSAIRQYVDKFDPIVFSINIIDSINPKLINYYLITHNSKFISQSKFYSALDRSIILPKHRFSDKELVSVLGRAETIDYGLKVAPNTFEVKDNYCVSPFDLTFSYAVGCAIVSGSRHLSLVGFDGYSSNDSRQSDMVHLLNLLKSCTDLNIKALTPTSYPIEQGSIYALN